MGALPSHAVAYEERSSWLRSLAKSGASVLESRETVSINPPWRGWTVSRTTRYTITICGVPRLSPTCSSLSTKLRTDFFSALESAGASARKIKTTTVASSVKSNAPTINSDSRIHHHALCVVSQPPTASRATITTAPISSRGSSMRLAYSAPIARMVVMVVCIVLGIAGFDANV